MGDVLLTSRVRSCKRVPAIQSLASFSTPDPAGGPRAVAVWGCDCDCLDPLFGGHVAAAPCPIATDPSFASAGS